MVTQDGYTVEELYRLFERDPKRKTRCRPTGGEYHSGAAFMYGEAGERVRFTLSPPEQIDFCMQCKQRQCKTGGCALFRERFYGAAKSTKRREKDKWHT